MFVRVKFSYSFKKRALKSKTKFSTQNYRSGKLCVDRSGNASDENYFTIFQVHLNLQPLLAVTRLYFCPVFANQPLWEQFCCGAISTAMLQATFTLPPPNGRRKCNYCNVQWPSNTTLATHIVYCKCDYVMRIGFPCSSIGNYCFPILLLPYVMYALASSPTEPSCIMSTYMELLP